MELFKFDFSVDELFILKTALYDEIFNLTTKIEIATDDMIDTSISALEDMLLQVKLVYSKVINEIQILTNDTTEDGW